MAFTEIEIEYHGLVAIDSTHVRKWMQRASKDEVAEALADVDIAVGYTHYIGLNAGSHAAAALDIQRVQELLSQMHVQDIIEKLTA